MTEDPDRPDPDALLALARREGCGRLKVFLGGAPGVGKTWEMLAEARRRAAGGGDVLIGIVETHGRAETQSAIGDLPILPRARLEYRGQVLEEFDLDAALARRPRILLLDELAHSNAPGSRHPKRWQDVEELRDAGIEVWTTMNVQHLESLSEAVARITGVRVAETVPDRVLAEAVAVELIDIPPAELIERMRQGKVYRADQVTRALRGFFREGNLAALREMALRRTAERVDADVTGYMRANAIAGPQDVVGVVVFGLVALLLAGTTGGLGRSVRAAHARLVSLRRLVEFSRRLGVPGDRTDIVIAVAEEAARIAGSAACVLLPLPPTPGEAAPEPVVRAAVPVEAEPDDGAMAAARWAIANGRAAGRGTDTLPASPWQFRPMRGSRSVVGLLGIKLPEEAGSLDAERSKALDALLDQAVIALERADLMEERARGEARSETETLRTALLTSLGHDLKTPLTSIRGAIGTLRTFGESLTPAARDDLLLTAEEETARLMRWIGNILDIVGSRTGRSRRGRRWSTSPTRLKVRRCAPHVAPVVR